MSQRRAAVVEFLLSMLFIPLSIVFWFAGFFGSFSGGGAWTEVLAISGILMFPVGIVVETIVGRQSRAGKKTPPLVRFAWIPLLVLFVAIIHGC